LKKVDLLEVRTASVITLMMEAVRTSETLVYFIVATWRYIPEGIIFIFAVARTLNLTRSQIIKKILIL
jgi:hypothetical protein